MTITLYKTGSEKTRLNKSLTLVSTHNGQLLAPTSMTDPVITFPIDTVPDANYCYIPDFGRYYFIVSIVSVSDGLWELQMHVDVLYTFRSRIEGCTAYIERQEEFFNGNLPDNSIMVEGPKLVGEYTGVNTDFKWQGSREGYLNTTSLGNHYSIIAEGTGLRPATPNNTVIEECKAFTHMCGTYTTFADLIAHLNSVVAPFQNRKPIEYLINVLWLPISLSVTGDHIRQLQIANGVDWVLPTTIAPSVVRYRYENVKFKVTVPVVNDEEEYFKNYSPYNELWLEFQPFGKLKLDNNIVYPAGLTTATTDIWFNVAIDTLTGSAILSYGRTENTATVLLGSASLGIAVPYSATYYNYTKMGAGLIGAGVSIAAGIATENPALIAGGVVKGVGSFVGNDQNQPMNGMDGKFVDDVPVVRRYAAITTDFAPETLGRSAGYEATLDSVTGFTRCGTVHVDNIYWEASGVRHYALSSELDEIEGLLKSGVIL